MVMTIRAEWPASSRFGKPSFQCRKSGGRSSIRLVVSAKRQAKQDAPMPTGPSDGGPALA